MEVKEVLQYLENHFSKVDSCKHYLSQYIPNSGGNLSESEKIELTRHIRIEFESTSNANRNFIKIKNKLSSSEERLKEWERYYQPALSIRKKMEDIGAKIRIQAINCNSNTFKDEYWISLNDITAYIRREKIEKLLGAA